VRNDTYGHDTYGHDTYGHDAYWRGRPLRGSYVGIMRVWSADTHAGSGWGAPRPRWVGLM
jgi:hypothetical protein